MAHPMTLATSKAGARGVTEYFIGGLSAGTLFCYLFHVPVEVYYGGFVAVLAALAIFRTERDLSTLKFNLDFLYVAGALFLMSVLVAQPAWFSIARTLGFLVIFMLLTACIPPDKAENYCRGVADTGV